MKFFEKYSFLIGLIIIFAYFIPYFILGENSYICVHDFLDIDLAHAKMLLDQHAVFDHDATLPILDGLSRKHYSVCYSPYELKMLLYRLLPIFWAIVVSNFIVKTTAYVGMYLFLSRYILKDVEKNRLWWSSIIACVFALIPFYYSFGLSSAGIPLLFFAFNNLLFDKNKISSYLIIAFFAYFSCFVLSGIFLCFILFFIYLVHIYKDRNLHISFFFGLLLLGVLYFFLNLELLLGTFIPSDFVSHRVEFSNWVSWSGVLTLDRILFTDYHPGKISTLLILILSILTLFINKGRNRKFNIIIVSIAWVIILCYSFGILKCAMPNSCFLNSFQFDRINFLLPTLWIILLSLCVVDINKYIHSSVLIIILLFFLHSIYLNDSEARSNVRQLEGRDLSKPNFSQFYDTMLFDLIADELQINNRSECKVVNVGMFPAVAEYNGFYTLDSYINIYSIDYKYRFREVIANELEKSQELQEYYDGWGSRCYIFSSELGREFMFGKQEDKHIHLDINVNCLRNLECDYIFSAVNIDNYKELGLTECGDYSLPQSYWKIHIYKI